jgi:flagellar export protein FliJ
MAFQFRLGKVLKVRQRILEQRTREVAEADRVRHACRVREQQLAEAYLRLTGAAPTTTGAILDVRDLTDLALRLRRLTDLRSEAARDTHLATLEWERQRDRLTEAWRDVEVLRKLESRRREQWEDEQRRLEGRLLDEIGGVRSDRLRRSKLSA